MALRFPFIFLLPTHLSPEELQDLEERIPSLTYDVKEAQVFLGRITRKERALFELRRAGLKTEELTSTSQSSEPPRKRRKSSVGSHVSSPSSGTISDTGGDTTRTTVKVVKLAWFEDSVSQGKVLPVDGYLLYEGSRMAVPEQTFTSLRASEKVSGILARARMDAGPSSSQGRGTSQQLSQSSYPTPHLLHESTSEHNADEQLPPVPDFLHTKYSCQRPTHPHPPNERFIEQLKKIRTTRLLTGDKIGVRAYSSAIASIAAYPYTLMTRAEVQRLPGCSIKVALLFQEFKLTGKIREVEEAETNPELSVLHHFHDVLGVGDVTAREWYKKGWRDLDDVVEYGWDTLSRVQQIGVKFYDELLLKIPRSEVESIAAIVLEHVNKIQSGFQMLIVGGYRRGSRDSGDVDLMLSHPDEAATDRVITTLVDSLSDSGHITHTLAWNTQNSDRGQMPISWKGNMPAAARGTGFDGLDKALVVWQNPKWTPRSGGGREKNPNPHRRVDIIVTPWKTAGCAVLGWSGGTTFQRDLHRYCRDELGLKFDCSGVRSRSDGAWVDLESENGVPAPNMLTAERRVLEGLKLEWRPPEERITW